MSLADSPAETGDDIAAFVRAAGLAGPQEPLVLAPLTGGVSSDIWRVAGDSRTIVVKRALARLRVAQDWQVPVSRNAAEVAWLEEAARALPDCVPEVLAHDPGQGLFAMTYFEPAHHPVWKGELAAGRVDAAFATKVGAAIAAVHAATAGVPRVADRFAHDALFHAIRLEPYLEATARAHEDLAPQLMALSAETLARHTALVHGDVSPKNILVGPRHPILLDAECAWYGDPAFDLAFCLNHLLLKTVWRPDAADRLIAAFGALSGAYLAGITWEEAATLDARAARLLPALLLARIDGKSPVEYITAGEDRTRVRRSARALILAPPATLAALARRWAEGEPA